MSDNPLAQSAANLAEILRKFKEQIQAIIDGLSAKKPLPRPQKKIPPRYAAPIIRLQHRARSRC